MIEKRNATYFCPKCPDDRIDGIDGEIGVGLCACGGARSFVVFTDEERDEAEKIIASSKASGHSLWG